MREILNLKDYYIVEEKIRKFKHYFERNLTGKEILGSLHGIDWNTGGVLSLSERYIQSLERLLDRIRSLEEVEGKDRLELVRSLGFILGVLHRSLLGWMQWVNNPDIMTRFTQEDLEKMNKSLSKFVRSFIEYDLEATKLGADKGLKARNRVERRGRKREERTEGFYV